MHDSPLFKNESWTFPDRFSRILKTCDDLLHFAAHFGDKANHKDDKTDNCFESAIEA